MNTKSFRRFNAFMDFMTVVFLGGFFILVVIIVCTTIGIQLSGLDVLAAASALFILGCALAFRQLYGKLATREIFREMTDEQYEKFIKR